LAYAAIPAPALVEDQLDRRRQPVPAGLLDLELLADVAHETLTELFMRRWLLTVLLLLSSAACATTRTRIAPVAPERVRAEEARQREIVLREISAEQQRLDSLAHPVGARRAGL
jgi:hypothetical protein